MSDNNCGNQVRCETCRTINLARTKEYPQVHSDPDTCKAAQPCLPVSEMPVKPACIKVCTREEYWSRYRGLKPPKPPLPPIGHGKFMYLVKAAILSGALFWTVRQGVWGDQQDVTEAINRWTEYIRSINTRRPPSFDKCGNVILKEGDSAFAPLYTLYKGMITTIFSGIVKFPVIVKCMYLDYVKQMELRNAEREREAQLRKK